uniref:Uncharacterized protein n=1 Tax=viral metagenome TaxID=1070528 RepID=A0A6M3M5P6_9ZZZZ
MATAKQRAVWKRMKRAAKKCSGKKKSAFRACMRKNLKKGR